jgi:hypothetical protein
MSNFQYTVGLNNVGSYQVAGSPYLTASTITEEEKQFSFPRVTKNITIHNTGSADIYFYFVSSPSVKLVLPADKKMNLDIKCASIYVSGSTQSGVQLLGELTNIPAARMFSLTGLEGV